MSAVLTDETLHADSAASAGPVDAVELLERALVALHGLDADQLSDARLHELVVGAHRFKSRLAGVMAPLVARWEGRSVWAGDGSRSSADRLARECGSSVTAAGASLKRSRQFLRHEPVRAAVVDGRLSAEQGDLLCHAAGQRRGELYGRDETILIDQLNGLRFAPSVKLVRYWETRADADLGIDRGRLLAERAHAYMSSGFDGTEILNAVLDPIGGTIVRSELDRLERDLHLIDQRDGVTRTMAQRRAAALVEMAMRSTAATGTPGRPLFTVLTGEETFAKVCELANGTVITPGSLVPYLTRTDVQRIVFAGITRVWGMSRQRSFPDLLRRAIQIRDRHCQHPCGCDIPAGECDIDHIVPFAHGGMTSLDNGRAMYRPHNRDAAKHNASPASESLGTGQSEALIRLESDAWVPERAKVPLDAVSDAS